MNPVVTTNQKLTIDTQKLDMKQHKHTTKENHQTTKEETKRSRKEQRRITKTTRKTSLKMAMIHTYVLIKCQWTKCSTKRHRVVAD